jgi:hypothetical protein
MAVRQEAKRQAQRPWVGWPGRLGLAAMGVSYGIVAVFALELALGVGGKATDRQGALHAVAGHPVGKLLLIILAIGFAGYAAWRIAQAAFNRGGEDDDAKGWAKRLTELGKAAIYVGLFSRPWGSCSAAGRRAVATRSAASPRGSSGTVAASGSSSRSGSPSSAPGSGTSIAP